MDPKYLQSLLETPNAKRSSEYNTIKTYDFYTTVPNIQLKSRLTSIIHALKKLLLEFKRM